MTSICKMITKYRMTKKQREADIGVGEVSMSAQRTL